MKLKSLLACILLLITLSGCGGCKRTVTEYSPLLTERAIVADLVYTPSRHGSGVGPTLDITGEGGIGVAITSVNIPQRYAVVFRCAHGKFIVENDQQLAYRLWQELVQGQEVEVNYREVYSSIYKEGQLLARHLIDFDFIDAK